MIKLNTDVKDTATGLKGRLTHMLIEHGGTTYYLFQPRGLTTKTREPLDGFWITPQRVKGGVEIPTPELPTEVLGTEVTDDASGFKGIAIGLKLHVNGCVHLDVQAPGLTAEGERIKAQDFDIRRLSGKAIKKMTEQEQAESERKHPSPAYCPPHH